MVGKIMIKYSYEEDKKMKRGKCGEMKYSCWIRSLIKCILMNSFLLFFSFKLVKIIIIELKEWDKKGFNKVLYILIIISFLKVVFK